MHNCIFCIVRAIGRGGTVLAAVSLCAGAMAAETRTYTYNARGELTKTAVSGGPVGGLQTTIDYDFAGNRTRYVTTGSTATNPLARVTRSADEPSSAEQQ